MPFDGPGAEEYLGPDLHVGAAVNGEPGDVRLLGGELAGRLDRRLRTVSPVARPSTTSSGSPAMSSPGTHAANTRPTGSAASRRAANPSACAEARSSHCASSTTQISGRSPAASDSKPSTARPTKNRSGAGPALRPNAVRSASRCGTGETPHDPASARTADAAPRRPAPSPTALPRPAPPGTPRLARPGSPAARSCPRRAHRAPPGPGPHRPAHQQRTGQARHVRCAGPSALLRAP